MDFSLIGILTIILQVLMVLLALSVHESAHGWMADKLGDPTARMLGRITLNPIKHIDPIGSILVPLAMAYMGGPIFGWAKPVPVQSRNFKNLRRDDALVSAAGPLSNLLLALISTALLSGLLITMGPQSFFESMKTNYSAAWWITFFAFLNLILAAFNLIPIPPLDGSWILSAVLPHSVHNFYERIRPFGFVLLLIIFFTPLFNIILNPLLNLLFAFFISIPLHLLAGML